MPAHPACVKSLIQLVSQCCSPSPDMACSQRAEVGVMCDQRTRVRTAIRNGHGTWPGLRTIRLLPSLFMPLCAPALRDGLGDLADPERIALPLLGRSDWWTLWYRALGRRSGPATQRFGTNLSAEYLDVAAAIAGQGIAIASPLLFRDEIAAGRLVPAHDAIASDGRAFWFACPAVRQHSGKLAKFRD